jgi:hypothetical protein
MRFIAAQDIVLSGIQVDNPRNRAYARQMDAQDIPWPPPYKNSQLAQCQACGGDILIGPEIQRQLITLSLYRVPLRLLCVLDMVIASTDYDDMVMVKLSGKKPGE